jgi:hypothetical protein
MFGGNVTAPMDPATTSATQFILKLAMMIVDRDALTGQLQELVDAIKEYKALRAEIEEREQAVLNREKQAVAHEEALAKRAADLDERELVAEGQLRRAEDAKAQFAAMRAELKQKLAA